MTTLRYCTRSPEETMAWAARLAAWLQPGDVLALCGELGSGKTCFTRGLAQGLGVRAEAVGSPTFVLMNIYEGRLPLYHFDAYRLSGQEAWTALGADEFLDGPGVCVIEWADRVRQSLPADTLEILFLHDGAGRRQLRLTAPGPRAQSLLSSLSLAGLGGSTPSDPTLPS